MRLAAKPEIMAYEEIGRFPPLRAVGLMALATTLAVFAVPWGGKAWVAAPVALFLAAYAWVAAAWPQRVLVQNGWIVVRGPFGRRMVAIAQIQSMQMWLRLSFGHRYGWPGPVLLGDERGPGRLGWWPSATGRPGRLYNSPGHAQALEVQLPKVRIFIGTADAKRLADAVAHARAASQNRRHK